MTSWQLKNRLNCWKKLQRKLVFRYLLKKKTKYISCNKQAPKYIETKYGKIKRVSQFKYLGGTIQENGIETKANKSRCQKMETAYRLIQNIWGAYKQRDASAENAVLRKLDWKLGNKYKFQKKFCLIFLGKALNIWTVRSFVQNSGIYIYFLTFLSNFFNILFSALASPLLLSPSYIAC